jgi:hypothetical protein
LDFKINAVKHGHGWAIQNRLIGFGHTAQNQKGRHNVELLLQEESMKSSQLQSALSLGATYLAGRA